MSSWAPVGFASAPGRVELLGNHVDYNGGPVLAAAIDRSTVVLFDDNRAVLNHIEVLLADVGLHSELSARLQAGWRNNSNEQTPVDYVRGTVAALLERGTELRSGRFVVASSVPAGVGVSSSAALCVALSMALSIEPLEHRELVLVAQEAEHRAGTPCGTMDQSASVAGGMIRFDGTTLNALPIHPELGQNAFLVIDSGVRRSLVSSSYPVRVDECRRALQLIQSRLGRTVANLATLTMDDLDSVSSGALSDEQRLFVRRARHVVSEVARVNEGEAALERGDWARFGQLMTESGQSSANDYEISHPIVEYLVARLRQLQGVLGARMMGGGEGGSLVALVRDAGATDIVEQVTTAMNHDRQTGEPQREVYQFAFAPPATLRPFPDPGTSD